MIECTKYRKCLKNSLLGFADIYIPSWDLEIKDLQLHQKNGKRWISFPSRAYEKDGEKKYAPYLRFRNIDKFQKFTDAVKKAIDKKCEEFKDEEIPF